MRREIPEVYKIGYVTSRFWGFEDIAAPKLAQVSR